MSEHTPGPWTVSHPVNMVEKHVRNENGVLICKCYWPNEDANTKLIAAAPMMLEALEIVTELLVPTRPEHMEILNAVNLALQKAKGEKT
jgi:hypothetical protein